MSLGINSLKLKLFSRGVSDVGFSIFADTDADFAF